MLKVIKDHVLPLLAVFVVVIPLSFASLVPTNKALSIEEQQTQAQSTRIQAYITRMRPSAPAERIATAIVTSAKVCKLDPYLVTSLMHTESDFRVDAESVTGARGLMQIVKSTFESLGGNWSMAYDIETNVTKGTCYLAKHVDTYKGRVDLALTRYNGNDDPRFSTKVLSRLRNLSDTYHHVIIVKKGDTLAGIAATYLGDAGMYPLIAEYNEISNPNLIEVGQRIVIGE